MSYANAKNKNGILEIEGAFGNKQSNGVQHKGMIDYEGQPKFFFFFFINPNILKNKQKVKELLCYGTKAA